jgi:flagellin
MALGVLNNLAAISAENNLNNTDSSLTTVLLQLSSGSKISSGADDPTALSLINGLQANSTALTQSGTNATEGVGLLDVADGALSQVTSLLDRAITLATEASNGTMNSTQDAAANQEYQSILAEISNIGSTTTYNNQQVFTGNIVAIYTGDSSTSGSSVDNLNIHTLSASSVGDTNGIMSYGSSTGSAGTNVFVDLSNNGVKAAVGDTLNVSGATSIQVTYLKTGANGVVTPTTATIGVGTSTSYANTVQGLMSAINDSGLGLTATFGTAALAGDAAVSTATAALNGGGTSSDTGIIISGTSIGTGTTSGQLATLTVGGTALDPLAGSLTITGSDGAIHAITLGLAGSTDNINNLAATINADGYGITASVSGTTLTFTSASSAASVSGANLEDTVTAVDGTAPVVAAGAAPLGNAAGNIGTYTLGSATDLITAGTLAVTGQSGTLTNFTLGTSGATDNLTDLAKTINNWATTTAAGAGITATVVGGALTIDSAGGGLASVQTALGLTGGTSDTVAGTVSSLTLTGAATTSAPSSSTIGTLSLGGVGESVTDVLNGTLTIGANTITLGGAGTTDTLQDLANTINSDGYGVTAAYSQTNKDIVFTSSNTALAATGALTFTASAGSGDQTTSTGTVTYAHATTVTTAENYYNIGISSTAGILDQSTAVVNGGTTTYGGTLNTGFTADASSTGSIATINYTDQSGQSLSGTDLLSSADAQTTLSDLNLAVSDVSAMDGYIGAQINTLNSISQVMAAKQQNVTTAQNALQATDYATATSDMSRFEILSQTGIAALAQANSVQQEVTKLLG